MSNLATRMVFLGALLGVMGVSLGAFGAHWLSSEITRWELALEEQTRSLEICETGGRYQLYHALALAVAGLLAARQPSRPVSTAGVLFITGVIVFSGLLYARVLTNVGLLGAAVPIGGVALIAGWIMLAVAVWQQSERLRTKDPTK